ncbi:2230_t:CDS:2 [Funneliformis geosporum]|uniref:2230_t:CDS:1 n=1 Tax=Funneliformis geosporum TaxID=1117311 RepID=A0A9W4X1K4_9GLOM|nr:2230_t:CDS:2 [Funneliformis geosporum]
MNKKKSKSKGDILLTCQACLVTKNTSHQNYRTTKTKKMQSQNLKLNLKKYCKFCQKTQSHKEGAVNRKKRDTGSYLEDLGYYNPRTQETKLNQESTQKWLKNGAQPTLTETIKKLKKKSKSQQRLLFDLEDSLIHQGEFLRTLQIYTQRLVQKHQVD